MTDLPDTDTLNGLLTDATPGPWLYRTKDYDDWGVVRNYDGWMVARASVASVSDEDADAARRGGYDPVEPTARLIALAPSLAARVIEQDAALAAKDARIAELEAKVERLEVISRGIVSLANELSWGKKTRDIAARIRAALEDWQ